MVRIPAWSGSTLWVRRGWLALPSVTASLAVATIAVAILESRVGVPNASPAYLVAVVAVAILHGTWPALATGFASFLLYDLLFINPRFTLTVSDPGEWVNLLLFLLVAVTIGRITAAQAERADEAARRARESQALFAVSRILATASSVDEAAPAVLGRLGTDARMDRLWLAMRTSSGERTVADTQPGAPLPRSTVHEVLLRAPGDQPPRWVRTHAAGPAAPRTSRPDGGRFHLFRIKVEADDDVLGSLWAVRPASRGAPTREETRLLSLAADQLALGVRRDRLIATANAAEIVRQSDTLKSALLDSVSHDLRTPLASIRAAAGSLMDPTLQWPVDEMHAAARAIDAEAERLDRLVRNVLDLSRIEGGALRPDLEVFDLDELLEPILDRLRSSFGQREILVDVPAHLPPVTVDAVLFDEVVTNLLENAAKYAGTGRRIRIGAAASSDRTVELVVEDAGAGVPAEDLAHLFDKFYRVRRAREGSRRGLGIGLSVVKGLAEAMGGQVEARPSQLGGLAIAVRLPAVAPVEEAVG